MIYGVSWSINLEGLPDYWGIETHKLSIDCVMTVLMDLEGLPDYWGIETICSRGMFLIFILFIWKDYPTTGVLKLAYDAYFLQYYLIDLEGLPDYWGIET